jgi:hypothetical protein
MTAVHTKRAKARRGRHTKSNVWDRFLEPKLVRDGETLDPGVNFFVLALEGMGFTTHFSCEGHPDGFYVTFRGSYAQVLRLHAIGYFEVQVEGRGYWSIRAADHERETRSAHIDHLRWAAAAWHAAFDRSLRVKLDRLLKKRRR